MIPRTPDIGETGLSAAEIPYLTYGNQTPSNPVSALLQCTGDEWQIECFRPAVPTLRSSLLTATGAPANAPSRRLGTLGKEPFRFGPLWFGREQDPQAGKSGRLGVEDMKCRDGTQEGDK